MFFLYPSRAFPAVVLKGGLAMKERKWHQVNTAAFEKSMSDHIKSGCGCDIPIFTFQKEKIGQALEGRIRPCYKRDRNDRARCAHIHSYSENGEDTVVAIRMSAMLWAAIANKDNPLWGRWIRITYKGLRPMKFGRAMKIFSVEVDKGPITENFESIPINPEDCKSRKPRKRRPVCSGVET